VAPDHDEAPQWEAIIDAGRAFHRGTTGLPRPAVVDSRTDWWAIADRQSWADTAPTVIAPLAPVAERLLRALTPLGQSQLIHGDLTGNVLFADGLPPAIIDVSPYWRPPAYADGVVIADALTWHGAQASLGVTLGVPIAAIARGLLFRLLTTQQRVLAGIGLDKLEDEAQRYGHAADLTGL
jgi:prepilin-type processing-associated H-X9-DG protein